MHNGRYLPVAWVAQLAGKNDSADVCVIAIGVSPDHGAVFQSRAVVLFVLDGSPNLGRQQIIRR